MIQKNHKILIVDDSKAINGFLKEKLTEMGFSISGQSYNGDDAIQSVIDNKPDLILMDIELPGNMNGFETTRHIQQYCTAPVIFLTSLDNEKTFSEIKKMKAAGFVKKPINTNELEVNIYIALEKHKLIQELNDKEAKLNALNKKLSKEIKSNKYYEKQILKSKQIYYSSFNSLSEALFVVDHDLNIILENNLFKQFMSRLGLNSPTLGNSVEAISKACPGFNISDFILVLKTGQEIFHKDVVIGNDLIVEIRIGPILNEDQTISRVITSISDITDLKKAEEDLKQSFLTTQTILENLPFGIIIVNSEKKIKLANIKALDLFKKSKEEIIDHYCYNHICNKQKNVCPVYDLNQTVNNAECNIIDGLGYEIPVLKTGMPIKIDNEDVLLESFIDISDLKEAQEEAKINENQLIISLTQQGLLADILIIFNQLSDFNNKINEVINIIGEFLKASRVYIFEETKTSAHITNTYEWCRPGIRSIKENQKSISVKELENLWKNRGHNGHILCENTLNLSPNERIFFEKRGAKSFLILPLNTGVDGQCFIGIEDCVNYRSWDEYGIEMFKTVTDIISNAFKTMKVEKTLSESEETNKAILNAIPDILFHFNEEGQLINYKASRQKEALLNTTLLTSKNVEEIFLNKIAKLFLAAIKKCLSQGEFKIEFETQQNGEKYFYEARYVKVNEKEVICIARDISERKQHMVELKKAIQKADEANKAKSEFLANMSHEIRTPLNAILGFSESLITKIKIPQHKSLMETIHSSGQVLLSLINDILDLSKIEANKLEIHPEPCSVLSLVNEIEQIFRQKTESKGLKFISRIEDNIPPVLMIDEIRVRQILLNLVGNAIKFTHSGSIKVVFDGNMDQNKVDLKISVEDTGIGIKKEQQDLIFDAFKQQSGQNTRQYGGTGLGLAICKRLVEKMGGEILLKSRPGKGSAFIIRLPDIEVSDVDSSYIKQEEELPDISFEPATILITDDIPTNIGAIKVMFDDQPLQFLEAVNGQEALDLLETNVPDLIIMDIRMPVLNGIHAARKIKSNPSLKNIPIVAYTASVIDFDNKLSKRFFNGMLPKPARKALIITEFKKYLKHREKKVDKPENEKQELSLSDTDTNVINIALPILENELVLKYEEILENLLVFETEELALYLHEFAEKNNIEVLGQFSDKLNESVLSFDVDKMQALLKEFGGFVEALIKQKKK